MADIVLTNDANFTAVSNCAVSGGSVSLLPYTNDCSALTDFTPTNTSAGTIDVTTNPGAITINCNTTNSTELTGPRAVFNTTITGDFDVAVEVEIGSNCNANYEGAFFQFYVNSSNYIRMGRFYNSSTGGMEIGLYKLVSGGTLALGASVVYSGTSVWLRLSRVGNIWTVYYSADGSDWTVLGATTAAISTTGSLILGAATYNTNGSCTVQYKTLTFLSGLYRASGTATVHDSGVSYIDAGAGFGLDLSTLAKTHTSGATVSAEYYHSNNAGDTPSYTSYTWAELIALSANGHRYHWLRLTMSNAGAAAAFDELTADTYAVDVTAPGDPTSTKFIQFETNNFALIWTEPEDSGGGEEASGLSHIELRCDVGESTYYLGVGAGGPEWQASPTSYWKFKEGLGGSGITPASDFIDESASGVRTYYARAVDNAGNKSSWAAFSTASLLATSEAFLTLEAERNVPPPTNRVASGYPFTALGVDYEGEMPSGATSFARPTTTWTPLENGKVRLTVSGSTEGTKTEFFAIREEDVDVADGWGEAIYTFTSDGYYDLALEAGKYIWISRTSWR